MPQPRPLSPTQMPLTKLLLAMSTPQPLPASLAPTTALSEPPASA